MNKLFILLILLMSVNLNSLQILVNKAKLNLFINTVQFILSQKVLQDSIINAQLRQLELSHNNQKILIGQIKSDSLYIEALINLIKLAKQRRWYLNPIFSSGLGYLTGTLITILIVSAIN